jgi:hypothetical protein
VTAAFYALSGIHWFYTLLGLNLMLHSLTTGGLSMKPSGPNRRRMALAGPTPLIDIPPATSVPPATSAPPAPGV